jgi:modulator of FtsH protease HflK
MNEGGPWGGKPGGSGGAGGDGNGGGPRNPWQSPPPPRRPRGPGTGGFGPTALDEFLKRSRDTLGGGGGGMPGPDTRKLWSWGVVAVVLAWLLLSSIHRIEPRERGVVMRLGNYATTFGPGLHFSLPAPIDQVIKVETDNIRVQDIGSTAENSENLMLTGDQNIIDLAYSVSWKVQGPELYLFSLANPDDTVREVAESAMRAEVARVTLDNAIGAERSAIETRVTARMQEVLDGYRSGIAIQGVAIKQADPPAAVNDAFKEVSAAQQAAQTYINQARAYAQQVEAQSKGEAAAFDKVFEEYRLAPDVTRRRMYYETMEKVLAKTDKVVVEAPGVTPYLPLPQVSRGIARNAEEATR